jgi:hypothetical protein
MQRICGIMTRTFGIASALCLALSLLVLSSAQADDPIPIVGGPNVQSSCANPCGTGEFPQCGNGKCDKMLPACSKHSCKLTADFRFCECNSL